MSATQSSLKAIHMTPRLTTEFTLSSITAGEEADYSHGGPHDLSPDNVIFMVIVRPTDGSDIRPVWASADDGLASDSVRLRFDTSAGGSLDGAQVKVRCEFPAMRGASGTMTA